MGRVAIVHVQGQHR